MGGARRGTDRLGVGVGIAEADVLLRGQREDRGILRHESDAPPKRRRVDPAEVEAVDAHASAGRIVVAHEEREERRLAGARRADDRHALAAPHAGA